MKKFLCVLLAALLLTAGAGLAEDPAPEGANGILYTAEPTDGSGGYCVLTTRDELRLTPDDTFAGTVTWTSDDPAVATVEDGRVRPVGPGIALILFTDGTAAGLCHVLVNDLSGEPEAAGALRIGLGGKTFQSSISRSDWRAQTSNPSPLKGTAGNLVYTVGDRYYVRSIFLFNIVCCALGKSFTVEGLPGELPQLCGTCAIEELDAPARIDLCGDSTMLLTVPSLYSLPDGTLVGKDLYTMITEDSEVIDAVCYRFLAIDGMAYEDVADYLDRFGVRYELDYDAEQKVLTVKLTKEGDA